MSNEPREFWIGNHKVLFDEEFLPFINLFKWRIKKDKKTYYVVTNISVCGKQTMVTMHRFLTGLRKVQVDHINRNGLDNRMENLRFATAKENSYNRVRKNSTGYRGVSKITRSNAFQASLTKNGKRYYSGPFKTKKEAALAYDKLSRKHHGEFGIRNFEE